MRPPSEETWRNLEALQDMARRRPEILVQFRAILIEQEFRPEPTPAALLFARWLYQRGLISG